MEIFTDGTRINFAGKTGTRIYLPDSVIGERILVVTPQEDNPTVLNYIYAKARQLTVGTNITVIGSDRESTKITGIYLGQSDGHIKILILPDNNAGEGVVNMLPVDKFSYKGVPAYIMVPGSEGQPVNICVVTTDIFWRARYQVSINDKTNPPTTQGVILSAHITNKLPAHFFGLLKGKLRISTGSHQNSPIHSYDSNYIVTEGGTHQVPLQLVKFQSLGHILCFIVDLDHHTVQVTLCETIQVEAGSQPGYMDVLVRGESGYKTVLTWLNDQANIPVKELICGTLLILSGSANSFELDLSKQTSLTNNISIKILPNSKGLVPSGVGFTRWEDGTAVSYHTVGSDRRVRVTLVAQQGH